MTEQRHLIWSNYDLDYEDWRDDLEEDHPELTEDERMALMYEINNRYLDDERVNLNIQLDQPILVIADLGLWNGRRTGYQEISSGNIRDCLYSGRDIEYATWYVDITHGTDFAQFLSFQITTSKEQNSTRTKAGYVKRSYTGRIKLYVPKEKWLKRLLSYGALKIHYDKDNGNKEIWEPVCRSSLRNLDDLEILNQYNAEIRGLYNYYRIAHNATVLNNFLYVMKYSMYKTFAGKYRTSMQKIIRKYTKGKDFVVTYQSKSGEKSVVFYNQGMRRDTHVDATNPDIIGRANENRSYTSLVQRLKGGQCEWCGATDVEIEIHHIRKLKDLSGKAEWERHMIARRRKTMALCHNCHVKLHAGKLD